MGGHFDALIVPLKPGHIAGKMPSSKLCHLSVPLSTLPVQVFVLCGVFATALGPYAVLCHRSPACRVAVSCIDPLIDPLLPGPQRQQAHR